MYDINDLYSKKVKAFVVDFQGECEGRNVQPKDVNLAAEYKKARRAKTAYQFMNSKMRVIRTKTEYVVLPVFGYGLWNNIWGFVALKADLNTIKE